MKLQVFHVLDIIIIFHQNLREQTKTEEKEDEIVKGNILKAFHFKSRKKGARQIKMTLEGQFQSRLQFETNSKNYEEI